VVNTSIFMAGMAVGAFGTSALIQFAPAPLHLTFAVLLAVFSLEAMAIWLTPETVAGKPGLVASLRPRVSVPPHIRGAFVAILPFHLASWILGGFYLSLVPSVVVAATGVHTPLTVGSVVAALMLAGAVTVYVRRGKSAESNLTLSTVLQIFGVAIVGFGVHAANVPILMIGTLLCGTGFGMSFLGCSGMVIPLARLDERAEVLASFYLIGYLAFSIPAIVAGFLAKWLGYSTTADIYTVAVVVLNLAGVIGLRVQKATRLKQPAEA
jgi:hypothetical protein